jgi:hypothetical protein
VVDQEEQLEDEELPMEDEEDSEDEGKDKDESGQGESDEEEEDSQEKENEPDEKQATMEIAKNKCPLKKPQHLPKLSKYGKIKNNFQYGNTPINIFCLPKPQCQG